MRGSARDIYLYMFTFTHAGQGNAPMTVGFGLSFDINGPTSLLFPTVAHVLCAARLILRQGFGLHNEQVGRFKAICI